MNRTLLLRHLFVMICLCLFWGLALSAAVSKSPTNDEPIHILRAMALPAGDLRFQFEHTPLGHRLIGLLLGLETGIPDLSCLPSYKGGDRIQIATELFTQNPNLNIPRLMLLARLPIILFTLLFGAILVRWGKTRHAHAPLILATLFAFSPNVLAQAAVATTDMVLIVTFPLAILAFYQLQNKPTLANHMWVGVTLGLALSAKVSAGILLPILLIWSIVSCRQIGAQGFNLLRQWAIILPIATLIVWAMYGFEFRVFAPLGFPLPAPTYLRTVFAVTNHISEGHLSFLLGELSREGWWYYFVVAFLVKTPTFFMIALVLFGLSQFLKNPRPTSDQPPLTFLWMPAFLWFTISSATGLNIGVRHILPIYPLLWLLLAEWIGRLFPQNQVSSEQVGFHTRRKLLLFLLILLGVGYGGETLWQQPDFIPYFNLFVGGSANGHQYLADSNLDWGQDLWQLLDYVEESSEPIFISYNGFLDLAAYGLTEIDVNELKIGAITFDPAHPNAGIYAISITHLQGLLLPDPTTFAFFRQQTPIKILGGTIYIYDIPPP